MRYCPFLLVVCISCSSEPESEFVGAKQPWPSQNGTEVAHTPSRPAPKTTLRVVSTRTEAEKETPIEVTGRQEILIKGDFQLPANFQLDTADPSQVMSVEFRRTPGGLVRDSYAFRGKLQGRRITFSLRMSISPHAGLVIADVLMLAAGPTKKDDPVMRIVGYTTPILVKPKPKQKP